MYRKCIVFCLLWLISGASMAHAQRSVILSFPALNILGGAVNSIAEDGGGTIWVATDGGVAGIKDETSAPFFPLNNISDGLLAANVQAVAHGTLEDGEFFFLGFSDNSASGIQYGRMTSNGLSPDPPESLNFISAVRGFATDKTSQLWAATENGVTEWSIGASLADPQEEETYASTLDIIDIEMAPAAWDDGAGGHDAAVVFTDGIDIFMVRSGDADYITVNRPSVRDGIAEMEFDLDGNLWVLEAGTGGSRRFFKIAMADLQTTPLIAVGEMHSFSNPSQLNTTFRAIAINPETNGVWIGTDNGAYTQIPDAGGLFADEGWEVVLLTSGSRVDEIHTDPAGNVWIGYQDGIIGLIIRNMEISSTRFIGVDAIAYVTVDDLFFYDNGVSGETLPYDREPDGTDDFILSATVGGDTKQLSAQEEADSGRFTTAFGFSLGASSANVFQVSGSSDVKITVTYSYRDINSVQRTIVRTASWANIVEFEDDLWIGGPCFVDSLLPETSEK